MLKLSEVYKNSRLQIYNFSPKQPNKMQTECRIITEFMNYAGVSPLFCDCQFFEIKTPTAFLGAMGKGALSC